MGKKYYGDSNPLTRSNWLEYSLNREFQKEWHGFCKNTMRQGTKVRFHWDRFEDKYEWGRFPYRRNARSWKKHRRNQCKQCTNSTKRQSIRKPLEP